MGNTLFLGNFFYFSGFFCLSDYGYGFFNDKPSYKEPMAEAGVHDLIRSICGGAGNRFKGSRCHYYEPSTGDCSLLKEGKMDTLFQENPRCNPKRMLEAAVGKNYRRYKDSINPADYITATVFTID
jgi:hypothetical protein